MADYREISQGYAQGAITAAILVNGGAAVAVLSQLSELAALGLKIAVVIAMGSWVFGVASGAVLWFLAFASTRYVDRSIHANEPSSGGPELGMSDKYMKRAICLFIVAISFFLAGSISMLVGYGLTFFC